MPTGQYTDADAVAPPSAGRYTDADVLPEQSISAAASEYGHKMLEAGKGIWNAGVSAAKHLLPGGGNDAPADIATAGVRFLINHHTEQEKILSDAEDSAKKGDWGGFFRNLQAWGINSSVPGFGTAVKEASDKWDQGDKAGAIADGAALVTQQALLQKAPDIAAGTVAGARAVGAGIKAGAPDVLGGGAKVIAGEALAKVPGMEYPARIGLGYPGARQIGKGMGKFGEAFGESLSPMPAKASPAAPAAGAAAAETLADGSTVQDIARGQGIKSWKNATADQKAGAKSIFDKLKAAETVAPTSAAGAPPPSPTPSAPRAQPASAAPTVLQPNGGPLGPPLAPQPAAAPSVVSAVRPENPPNVVEMPKAANTAPEATPAPEVVKTANRTFVKDNRPSAEDYTLMEVPTAKLDAGWSKEGPAFYIPPGGGGAEIGGRLARAQEFIQSGTPVEAPRVSMAENGRIAFEDGRHRFAAMRDAGDPTVGVMVPHEQVADFQSLSKPAPAPASEAPSVRNGVHQANVEAKAQRFVDAVQQMYQDHPDTAGSNVTFTPGTLRQALVTGGYIRNTEVFPEESWPLIQKGIEELKPARQTIRPPKGFSMGQMGTKF